MNKMSLLGLLTAIFLTSCTQGDPALHKRINQLEARLLDLRPALGEVMGVIQQHHAKLYYAGSVGSWALAAYELDELKEGLDSAVKLYPHFKEVKVPLTDAVKITESGVQEVETAIKAKNKKSFIKSHESLTQACNACHQTVERGFVVIKTPARGEFSNQQF